MNKRAADQLLNILLPQSNCCHVCGRFLTNGGVLCDSCLYALRRERLGKHTMLAYGHPPLSACVSAFVHDGTARQLVHLLKYQANGLAAEVLGEGMALAFARAWKERETPEMVVPVPLHERRKNIRGYNQAQLLAEVLCTGCGLTLAPDVLVRTKAGSSQVGRGRAERLKAMIGSFSVPIPQNVRGKRILLVDDVLTTGATAVSCAVALLDAGAKEVSLATACRVQL